MSQGFFVEVLQGEVVYFWGNLQLNLQKVNKCLIIY